MDGDQIETELIKKISELEQEAKEHQLVLDAFKSVEPSRKCFRMIGGVLVERTVQDIKPSLEENLLNIDKTIANLNETIRTRREERARNPGVKVAENASKVSGSSPGTVQSTGVLA